MKRTKEMRWFFKRDREQIKNWFSSLAFVSTETRTDFYLKLENEDIGVKLRDGNIEIKQRIGPRGSDYINSNIWGYCDSFDKWSFDCKEKNPLLSKIVGHEYEEWIAVEKQRKVALLTKEDGEIIARPLEEEVSFGCEIEYAEIFIEREKWFTFALEWFGTEFLKLDSESIADIVGDTKLNIRLSRSYPNFLMNYNLGQRNKLLPLA